MAIDPAPRLTGISSMATRHALADLVEDYERQGRQRVAFESVGGVEAARRVKAGEPFDFVVLASDAVNELAAAGLVHSETRIDFARSGVAIAVRAGASRPDVSDERAIRDAVLRAGSIGYSTGPSGAHVARLLEGWGVGDTVARRLVQAPAGVPVGTLVARGEVELGFQQLSELMHLPGIDVVGLLPAALQRVTVFSAAVCAATSQADAAVALLTFLASPNADAAKCRHGMEPARTRAKARGVASATDH